MAKQFLAQVVELARDKGLVSDEHFTVDGTLLEAWASVKSYQRKDGNPNLPPDDPGNPTVNFHGEKRSNQTHESKTDPEAKMARKGDGKEAKLSYSGNLLVENRNGLIVDAMAWEANGRAERDTALLMLEQVLGDHPVTVGGDKGFDTREFVSECRHMGVTPHVAQNHGRPGGSAIDQRTTRHAGYRISQRKRKRIEGVGDVEAEAIFTFLPKVTCGSGFYNQDDIRHRKDMVQALILSDPEKRKKFEDELGQELLEYYVDQALKGETILIPVQPISTIIRQCRLHNIDLLKIDVEGGDIKALHGIEENQWPVIKQFVLGVHDSRNNLPEVTAILEERGVNVIAVPENSGDISGVTMAYATRRG